MIDLAEYLRTRIADDQATAREATKLPPSGPGSAARIVAECEAKRQLIALHSQTGDGECSVCANGVDESEGDPFLIGEPWPCSTLRLLALAYAGEPGYRAEWLP